MNVVPSISEAMALQNALDHLGAIEYTWENEGWELDLQEDQEDPNATYFPTGELHITNLIDEGILQENYKLAWRFDIMAIEPTLHVAVYIDAHTGSFLKLEDQHLHAVGTATTLYNGDVDFHTAWFGGLVQKYVLKDKSGGHNIHTKEHKNTIFWGGISNIKDADNIWESSQAVHSSPHWAAHVMWDYFETQHNWKGPKNQGEKIRIFSKFSPIVSAPGILDPGNVSYEFIKNKHYLNIGELSSPGGALIPAGALDVVSHEWTHGICSQVAKMAGVNEPGALQESFCDIFGELAEYHHNGNPNWIASVQFQGARSLSFPPAYSSSCNGVNAPHPISYRGLGWIFDPNCDFGGVHINCGVQNRWFYSLAVDQFAIGIEKAADITFYNLTKFMQSGSTYPDARSGSIIAARILYGQCSGEEKRTTNAWNAVGVGPTFEPCIEINGPDFIFICDGPAPFDVVYKVSGGATPYTWSINAGWTFYTQGIGNNTLVVTDIPPPPSYPATTTISATSATGVTKTINVSLDHCGGGFCDEDNGFSARKKNAPVFHSTPETEILLFPNPVHDLLNIRCTDNNILSEIEILDVTGKIVWTEQINNGAEISISTDRLAEGLYFFRGRTTSGFKTLRFIKTNL